MTLIRDGDGVNGLKKHKAKMTLEGSPFSEVFGPKAQRKRVRLNVSTVDDLVDEAEKSMDAFEEKLEQDRLLSGALGNDEAEGVLKMAREHSFSKGQSKRIWNELYKVLDSSDVVLHVLDARDPEGTRCRSVEKYLHNEAKHKHLVFILNKTDLVPTSVAAAWVRKLSKDAPTLAFHASITNSFGKGSLISLLRQFSSLHAKNRKEIAVGLIGYPNVGKSSIINTLRAKTTCTTAPIPGCTKVWQYVSLMKRISMIDCPGIVPPNMSDTPEDILLRGVVRVENVENPEQYIPALFARCKRHHIERTYELVQWTTHTEFLERLARKTGRLLKAGEPDLDSVARMVITDFLRGKIPWFTPCPDDSSSGSVEEEDAATENKKKRKASDDDGEAEAPIGSLLDREGVLGEKLGKRKREAAAAAAAASASVEAAEPKDATVAAVAEEEDEFSGFDSEYDSADDVSIASLSDDDSEADDGGDDDDDDEPNVAASEEENAESKDASEEPAVQPAAKQPVTEEPSRRSSRLRSAASSKAAEPAAAPRAKRAKRKN